jgi:hypothetical protein
MRLVLALFGGLAGFSIGASIMANLSGAEPLGDVWSWLGAVIGAVLLGALAYVFWALSVVLGLASVGFFVSMAVMSAFDVHSAWLTLTVGIAGGVLFGFLAVIGNLPAMVLVVVTAFSGASVILNSVLLLLGRIRWEDLARESAAVSLSWWWLAGYLALAVIGIVVQIRWLFDRSRDMKQHWSGTAADGGTSA